MAAALVRLATARQQAEGPRVQEGPLLILGATARQREGIEFETRRQEAAAARAAVAGPAAGKGPDAGGVAEGSAGTDAEAGSTAAVPTPTGSRGPGSHRDAAAAGGAGQAEVPRPDPAAADGGVGRACIPDISAAMSSAERQAIYAGSPAAFVTARILVVDLLTARLPPDRVRGLLVLNAHRVTESNGEGFATRLLRAGNPLASVRGLSEAAGTMAGDFNRAEKVLKALFLRRLHLWPRFQAQVRADLEQQPPQVRGPPCPSFWRWWAAWQLKRVGHEQ